MILFMVLLFSGCQSFVVRSSPEAFRTGKVLEEGEKRITTNTILIAGVPAPILDWRASMGLPYGIEATAGWGIHALEYSSESTDGEESDDDFYQGPEVFLSKNLINLNDTFYLAATVGSEVDLLPVFDYSLHGGVDFGFYPVSWFTIFGHTKLFYHSEGYLAPQAGLGLGIDGPFILKAAAYSHFKEESEILDDGSHMWPLYYGLEVGFKFK